MKTINTSNFLNADAREYGEVYSRLLKKGLLGFSVVLMLLAWGLFLFQVEKNRNALLTGLEHEQKNLASVLGENLFQVLEQRQTIELFALKWFDGTGGSVEDIKGFFYGERNFTRIVFYDLSGSPFYESSPGRRQASSGIKKQIKKMLETGRPVLIGPDRNLSGISWQVPFLFPIKKGTAIRGAMLLEMDFGYFLNLLQDINIGRTGTITVQYDQGGELARFESGGLVLGASPVVKMLAGQKLKDSGSGIFRHPDVGDYHLTYLRAYGYPFIITIGIGLKEFFADFDQYRNRMLWILAILTSLGILGVVLLFKMIDRKQAYMDALALSNQRNHELIQKLEKAYKASAREASRDPLTQLYNRNLFVSLAEKNLLKAKRNKFYYAVLFLDLDRFKQVNDTLGHHIGDLLLQEVGIRLEACTRKTDIISRFGGDEFAVMLTELNGVQDISPVAGKLLSSISAPFENLDGHRLSISPSIGIAVYPRDGEELETLMLNADTAMYRAKRSGRGQYRFSDPGLNPLPFEAPELERRLPPAVAAGEFVLHYQPKIRLKDYRVVGFEALVRWQHSDHDLVFPKAFIRVAERTGLIKDLGAWVIEAVCRQMAGWRASGMTLMPVSVNVSSLELRESGYAARFQKILESHDIPFPSVEIEITEDAVTGDSRIVVDNLKALFDRGVTICLDNFGKEGGRLDHVRRLPISSLKIDQSVIKDIRNRYNDAPIVSSTIILAKKLNLTVVAQGIETNDQLVNLKVAGCDQVQGYYFSRPLPERKVREFIISPIRRI